MAVVIEGLDGLLRKLRRLDDHMQNRIIKKAVTKGAAPITQTQKANAPVDTGLLRISIGRKVKSYRKDKAAVAIVGARKSFKATKRRAKLTGRRATQQPSKYIRFVERRRPFVVPSRLQSQSQTLAAMTDEIVKGIRIATA